MVTTQARNKKVVREFFKRVMEGRPVDNLPLFAPDCRQHNPYVRGGMGALFEAMRAVQQEPPKFSDPGFAVKRVLAEGNEVIAHTELLFSTSKPGEGGLRQAHVFRFGRKGKIVEYWDITQMVPSDLPNAANAFDTPDPHSRRRSGA